uniref:Uncharacterized protein n=1 Tax=Micromonas pusilla TaxID=38833 RepID=A0A7S0D0A5_MICPS|mmetsp:Transcript_247/g.1020  ORF Transcript_247/g.1020 Transcript_247/m.1020 type:complete len:308 (+) Transcript_247:785-1708(+)
MAANDETRKKEPKKKASFDGTADAFLFAAGAAAFAARWEKKRKEDEDASSSSASSLAREVTVRWVDEPDPLVRRRVAPGYLVLEGARVDVVEDDVFEEDVFEEEDDAFFENAAEEDDQAARFRFPAKEKEDHETENENAKGQKTTLLFSYHAVYSPSYRAPVLLARARRASPPRATLTSAELDRALFRADPGGVGSTSDSLERPRGVSSFAVSASPRSVFAPWEHPHAVSSGSGDTGGCWLGAHPCETPGVMRLLLSAFSEEDGEAFGEASDDEKAAKNADAFASAFFAAWFAFASRAVPGLGSVAR